jgi:phytanoyl-CoA hydroxylase
MAMLTNEQLDRFRRDGYLVYGPLLDQAVVDEVGERIDALATGAAPVGKSAQVRLEPGAEALRGVAERDKAWQLMNVAKADDVIRNVAELPQLTGLVRQLLQTTETSFLQDQVLMKPAFHGSKVSWHQDSGYWKNIEPWIDPPAIVTCWVAIDNVTEDNGCVRMVPGSHKHGVLEHRRGEDSFLHVQGVDLEAAQPVVLPPGGVSIHHSCTVHGSAPNRSPNRRRGLALTYVRDDARRLHQP